MHRWIRNPKAPSSLWDGLVLDGAYAGLHPGSNRFVDGSGLENHGTLTNMDASTDWVWSDELDRGSIDFAAGNQHTAFATPVIQAEFSVFVWSKPRTLGGNNFGRLISSVKREVVNTATNRVYVTVNGGTVGSILFSPNSAITLNAWSSINASVTGGVATLRVNGTIAVGLVAEGAAVVSNTVIGNIPGSLNRGYDGILSTMLVWNRPTNDSEYQWLADRSNRMYVPDTRRAIWVPTPFNPALMRRRRRMAGAR